MSNATEGILAAICHGSHTGIRPERHNSWPLNGYLLCSVEFSSLRALTNNARDKSHRINKHIQKNNYQLK